ncbi:hypothetical protein HN587_04860 [Candidatus Woesearchaeota archaeon]|jgi:glutathione synthase/RimK-type ligase-like ATP-grasp enzyme|nr:hypothetical protein [Candidatus Woesearchaeota archaeon]
MAHTLPKVYFSVEEGFQNYPEEFYRTSRRILSKLSDITDLFLVVPGDYNLEKGTIKKAFRFLSPTQLQQILGEHQPEGDMFIIYGDETSKNIGLEFAKRQYQFLQNLKSEGAFKQFLNEPETEEATLKDRLVELSKDPSLNIAETIRYTSRDQTKRLIQKYGGQIILKPIFGCRGSGVTIVTSLDDLFAQVNSEDELKRDYILQEPLDGSEVRVVLLDDQLLCSRVHHNRKTPWDTTRSQTTYDHSPTTDELEITSRISTQVGAYLIGVDFIGPKVNEINGTGTGLVIYDHTGNLIYDKTDEFVRHVMSTIQEDHQT